MLVFTSLPDVAFVPDQSPAEATQLVVLVEDQDIVEDPPLTTGDGIAFMFRVGRAGGVTSSTSTITPPLIEPPGPVHVIS